MRGINYLKEIRARFDAVRAEVGDYKPEAFEYLEKRFYELYEDSRWRFFVKKDLKEGRCPVKRWIECNYYPKDRNEKMFLEAANLLTEDSGKIFSDLMSKYLFKLENSKAFREYCERLRKYGFNSLAVWMDKNGFEPAFKQAERKEAV